MKVMILIALFLSFSAMAQLTNESEISLIQSGGNSEVQTTNAKTTNKYKWDEDSLTFGGHYTYGETSDDVTVRNWDVLARYERELTKRFSLVFGEIIEGNKFVSIKARYNTDLGFKYFYTKTDKQIFFTELAYRYAIEDRYEPIENIYDNKARLYNEFDHKFSETMQYKIWLEYVPNFTEGKDYLVNGEVSLTAIMNSVFSLKVAYKGIYDNAPAFPGFKNYDYITTTSLVAKF